MKFLPFLGSLAMGLASAAKETFAPITRTATGEYSMQVVEVQCSHWPGPRLMTIPELRALTERVEADARIKRERSQRRLKAFHTVGVGARRNWSDARKRRTVRVMSEAMQAVAYANELRIKLHRATGQTVGEA